MNSDRKSGLSIAVKSVLERTDQGNTHSCFVQISSTKVPVNGLVRPRDGDFVCAVHDTNPPMENPPLQ
jgi:copper homeostasis protein CutC